LTTHSEHELHMQAAMQRLNDALAFAVEPVPYCSFFMMLVKQHDEPTHAEIDAAERLTLARYLESLH
jgi:hypothetical protein